MSKDLSYSRNFDVITAIFSFLEGKLPWLTPLLEKIKQLILANSTTCHNYMVREVGASLSPDDVKNFVDTLFKFAETLAPQDTFLKAAIVSVNNFCDVALLSKLIAYLESIGLVTP